MREILFRAYDKGRKEYLSDGKLFIAINKSKEPSKGEIYLDVINNPDKYKERFIIEQYTGINVGNEKLFEGDIVEWHEDYDDTWGYSQTTVGRSVVVWDKENFCWAFKTDDKYIQAFNDWSWNNSYIIGNIHDNPELLKGE